MNPYSNNPNRLLLVSSLIFLATLTATMLILCLYCPPVYNKVSIRLTELRFENNVLIRASIDGKPDAIGVNYDWTIKISTKTGTKFVKVSSRNNDVFVKSQLKKEELMYTNKIEGVVAIKTPGDVPLKDKLFK